jgi:predicted phosphohydrolase
MQSRSLIALAALIAVALCATGAAAGLAFTVYGDWGVKSHYAGTLAKVSEKHNSNFIAAIGDNFYREYPSRDHTTSRMGVKSVDDPKWKRIFENVYTQKFFQNKWYVVAGNHDYNGNEKAEVQYTQKSDRWYFPSFYYTFEKSYGKGTVEFFMLDTVPLYYNEGELKRTFGITGKDTAQIKWLEAQLKASKADWKIVMGHHQIYMNHGSQAYMAQHLVPLFKKYKVSAYINGHIHCVEHIEKNGIHYITQGNAAFQGPTASGVSKDRKAHFLYPTKGQYHSSTCHNQGCLGFSIVDVKDSKHASVYYYNKAGHLLKTVAITNRK